MNRISASRSAFVGRMVVASVGLLALSGMQAAGAQGFVTGSANTDGFSIIGSLQAAANGKGKGDFTIIVHRDSAPGKRHTLGSIPDIRKLDTPCGKLRHESFLELVNAGRKACLLAQPA